MASCTGGEDDGITAEAPLGLGEEGVGRCLLFGESVSAEVETLPVIDCNEQHTHQIFAVVDFKADVYPGFAALEDFAQIQCLAAFEPYVGSNPFDSELFYSWLVPTIDGWNNKEDREVLCVVGLGDGAMLTGSVRNTGR